MPQNLSAKSLLKYGFVGLVTGLAVLVVIAFFRSIPPVEGTPLGFDWRSLWHDLRNGQIHYDDQLRIPPWSAAVVLPLGLLSMRDSWALLTLLTLAVLIASVPRLPDRKWLYWLSIFLLTTSYLSLRHLIDGNFEALVISGILLFLYAYPRQNPLLAAVGLLLASSKPQETWLFLIAASYFIFRDWPRKQQLILAAVAGLIILPSVLWIGHDWLSSMAAIRERGSLVDISLSAALGRLGLPTIVFIVGGGAVLIATFYLIGKTGFEFNRLKACFLLCVSMLLAPYTAGNSFLTIVAIEIIPMWLVRPWLGALLILLSDLLFLASTDFLYYYASYYWTGLLIVTWCVMGISIYAQRAALAPQTAKVHYAE